MSITLRIEFSSGIPSQYKLLPRSKNSSLKDNYIGLYKRGKTFVFVKYLQDKNCEECNRGCKRIVFVSNGGNWNNRIVRIGCTECSYIHNEIKIADIADKIKITKTKLSKDFTI